MTKFEDNINHELFHVSSTRRNMNSGIVLNGEGYCLTEGITEYFNLKSKNIRKSMSGYQLELFVIEFLVFIYGEQILEPYFLNNGKKFFEQFGDFKDDIVYLEELLKFASNNNECQFYRLFYLCLVDCLPGVIRDSESFFKNLELNHSTLRLIKYYLVKENAKIEEFIEANGQINVSNYKFKNFFFETIYNEFILEYNQIQKSNFREILDILTDIALKRGVNLADIIHLLKLLSSLKRKNLKCYMKVY